MIKTVIMAGGKGTRIAQVRDDVPKPMIEIAGKPILEHQINCLKSCGIKEIILVVGHLGHVIKNYFGDGSRFGVNITYYVEDHPLGTAGALLKMPELTEDFLLLCGDVMLDVDFNRFIRFHKEHRAWASLVVHPNNHPYDSSIIVTETLPPMQKGGMPVETCRVVRWLNKEEPRKYLRNVVNAGIEIISPELLEHVRQTLVPRHPESPDKVDLDRDVLKPKIGSRRIFAYHTPEYIKDMGTPERLKEATHDFISGRISARNLRNKQRAVFLDRDGTINVKKEFLVNYEEIELIEGAAEAIRAINNSGYLAMIVTNQPQIARGECPFEQLQMIHNKLESELGNHGAFVDGIYFCPHHTDRGFDGERVEYKINCDCRKPKPGLLKKAAEDFNIDLSQSFMIGDSNIDIQAGISAGCKDCILIETNAPSELRNAVNSILNL